MIQVEDCFYLGYVKRIVGLQGEVEILLDVDDPSKYRKKESMLLMIKNNLVPFFIAGITIKSGSAIVKFNNINSEHEAEQLSGAQVYLPLKELPPLKGKNKFYYHEVIGFAAIDVNLGPLGIIKDIVDLSTQPVIQIMQGEKEILVPLTNEFIVEVKKDAREFILKTPEGLVDIYLKPE